MITNIFTQANAMRDNTKNRSVGIGEYVKRNGMWSMNIRPEPFYKNYGTDSYIFKSEIDMYKNYPFYADIWLDVDDVIYNGNNVSGGLSVSYTDGTRTNFAVVIGGQGDNKKGFQHIQFISDKSKVLKAMDVYYYVSLNVYYRLDSFIMPLVEDNLHINKQGIINTNNYVETQDLSLSLSKVWKEFYFLYTRFYRVVRDYLCISFLRKELCK